MGRGGGEGTAGKFSNLSPFPGGCQVVPDAPELILLGIK